jgi:hypothetical protein
MNNPYRDMAPSAFWRKAVAGVAPPDLDPLLAAPFTIARGDKIVSAGSCFAQHISRFLSGAGYNYLVTEPAHPILNDEDAGAFNFGTFSARYGNIYTARQLLQLMHRVYGRFCPADDVWHEADGALVDPFRPRIQPGGFRSKREYELDRARHFEAVRRAFEELDVFIFTFGLTEAWRAREDGAVYPLCPGVAGGRFDPNKHEFHNFTVDEIVADMLAFIDELHRMNPAARCILTVSPVPLVATAEDRHVLVSTTYSKSVLRVACEEICKSRKAVGYFPAYEIVTGSYNRGAYFAPDLRSVTEEGVAHVMRVFMRHFAGVDAVTAAVEKAPRTDAHSEIMERLVALNCEEEALDAEQEM